jgi:tRNA U54 and U55 pseudouridine synthase Pus10
MDDIYKDLTPKEKDVLKYAMSLTLNRIYQEEPHPKDCNKCSNIFEDKCNREQLYKKCDEEYKKEYSNWKTRVTEWENKIRKLL